LRSRLEAVRGEDGDDAVTGFSGRGEGPVEDPLVEQGFELFGAAEPLAGAGRHDDRPDLTHRRERSARPPLRLLGHSLRSWVVG
jgi:hypothetical protein